METYYDILGVAKNASAEDINKAFRKLALKHHPNKGGDAEEFKKLSDAHDTLEDAELRSAYNVTLVPEAEAEESLTKQGIKHMSEGDVLDNLKNAKTLDKKILERLLRRAEELDLFHHKEYEKALKVFQKTPRGHTHRVHRANSPPRSHGAAGGSLSEEDAELLQHLNNTRHTVVPNTRNVLRALMEQAESRGLTGHRQYQKAAEKFSKLSRRRTRRR